MSVPVLAFEMTTTTLAVIAIVGIAMLGVAWFGVKFWLAFTRPPDIKEIRTPNLDRINQQALAGLGDEDEEDEEAPEDLQKAADEPGGASPEPPKN